MWGGTAHFQNWFDEKAFHFVLNIIQELSTLALGYFFATTAYFTYRDLTPDGVKGRIYRRVHTLLIPYLLWNLIYFVFYLVRGYQISQDTFWGEVVYRVFNPFAGSLWYVLAVFVLSLLAPLVIRIINHRKSFIVLYILLCVVCFYFSVIDSKVFARWEHGWYFIRLMCYLPNYFLGAIYASWFPNFDIRKKSVNLVFMIFFVIALLSTGLDNLPSALSWLIGRCLPVMMFLAFPVSAEFLKKDVPQIFHASFIIYALHEVIVTSIHYILYEKIIDFLVGWSWILVRLATTIFTIVVSYIIWYILKKYCNGMLQILTGGR